jgi:hypothetical protein
MFSPFSITRGKIVNASQKLEFINGHLLCLDSQFLVQLSLSGSLDTFDCSRQLCTGLSGNTKRVLKYRISKMTAQISSLLIWKLAEQHVFVHRPGKVIFSVALCWSRRRFFESKRKTENAR